VLSNSALRMGLGVGNLSTTCFAHTKYSLRLSSLEPSGGLFRMARRFDILSANLMTYALGRGSTRDIDLERRLPPVAIEAVPAPTARVQVKRQSGVRLSL